MSKGHNCEQDQFQKWQISEYWEIVISLLGSRLKCLLLIEATFDTTFLLFSQKISQITIGAELGGAAGARATPLLHPP